MFHLSFTAVLLLGLIVPRATAGTEKPASLSPAQAEVRALIDAVIDAEKRADIPASLATMHAHCRFWDFAEKAPLDKAGVKAQLEGFFKDSKLLEVELSDVVIDVVGDTGAGYMRYKETIRPAAGPDITHQGSWAVTVIKSKAAGCCSTWFWQSTSRPQEERSDEPDNNRMQQTVGAILVSGAPPAADAECSTP